MIKILRSLFLLEAMLCFLFFYLSNGPGYHDPESGFISSKSLYSSGSDDDIAIFLLGGVNLFIFLILLIKKYSLTGTNLVVGIGFIFQIFTLILMQVSFISDTIIHGHDYYMFCIALTQIGILGVTFYFNAFGTKHNIGR